jgi:hypothetical protein
LIETGAYTKEVRRISRAVRLTIVLRRQLSYGLVSGFLSRVLPVNSDAYKRLVSYVPKVRFCFVAFSFGFLCFVLGSTMAALLLDLWKRTSFKLLNNTINFVGWNGRSLYYLKVQNKKILILILVFVCSMLPVESFALICCKGEEFYFNLILQSLFSNCTENILVFNLR